MYMSKSNGFKVLNAIVKMAEDDNKALSMSNTIVIVSVYDEMRGAVVGFGVEREKGDDVRKQLFQDNEGKYLAVCFFIEKEELKKYLKEEEL